MSSEEDGIPSECLYFYIFSSIVPPGHPGSLGLQSLLGEGNPRLHLHASKGGRQQQQSAHGITARISLPLSCVFEKNPIYLLNKNTTPYSKLVVHALRGHQTNVNKKFLTRGTLAPRCHSRRLQNPCRLQTHRTVGRSRCCLACAPTLSCLWRLRGRRYGRRASRRGFGSGDGTRRALGRSLGRSGRFRRTTRP